MLLTIILSIALMALLFLMILIAVALVQQKVLFGSAPKDIQRALLDHEERFAGARILGWVLLVLCAAAYVGAFVLAAWDGLRHGYNFWQFFGRFLAMFYLVKAFDIIFLDWYLLTKSHFYQHFYPETEGCAGYHNFGFNRKEQIRSIIAFPLVAFAFAWVCVLI